MTTPTAPVLDVLALGRATLDLIDAEPYAATRYAATLTLMRRLVEFGEERMKINVGLLAQNEALRAAQRKPETIDLSEVGTADLLAEIARRAS